ncbi:MAG: 50S ribosomal protein L20 [Calditrichaeota bacterium]|nr:50S ribosomal protein L20 [Calditrichota bacterium]
MPRAKNNVAARKRRKKILKAAKGYRLGKGRLYKTAKDQVEKGWLYAYRDRRAKKRTFRRLWITRINAACRLNGVSYSVFMHALKEANVALDRKVLADMAIHNPEGFSELVKQVVA